MRVTPAEVTGPEVCLTQAPKWAPSIPRGQNPSRTGILEVYAAQTSRVQCILRVQEAGGVHGPL